MHLDDSQPLHNSLKDYAKSIAYSSDYTHYYDDRNDGLSLVRISPTPAIPGFTHVITLKNEHLTVPSKRLYSRALIDGISS